MKELLERLERWLREHRPAYLSRLQPGLAEPEIQEFERSIGRPLPESFKALYRWRNGQDPDFFEALQFNRSFLSMHGVIETRDELNEMLDSGEFERANWWSRAWIPFLSNGGGDLACVDLDGAFDGKAGQVLLFWHDWEARSIECPDLESWLRLFVDSLEAGLWRESDGDFQPHDDAELDEFLRAKLPGYPVEHEAGG